MHKLTSDPNSSKTFSGIVCANKVEGPGSDGLA